MKLCYGMRFFAPESSKLPGLVCSQSAPTRIRRQLPRMRDRRHHQNFDCSCLQATAPPSTSPLRSNGVSSSTNDAEAGPQCNTRQAQHHLPRDIIPQDTRVPRTRSISICARCASRCIENSCIPCVWKAGYLTPPPTEDCGHSQRLSEGP